MKTLIWSIIRNDIEMLKKRVLDLATRAISASQENSQKPISFYEIDTLLEKQCKFVLINISVTMFIRCTILHKL